MGTGLPRLFPGGREPMPTTITGEKRILKRLKCKALSLSFFIWALLRFSTWLILSHFSSKIALPCKDSRIQMWQSHATAPPLRVTALPSRSLALQVTSSGWWPRNRGDTCCLYSWDIEELSLPPLWSGRHMLWLAQPQDTGILDPWVTTWRGASWRIPISAVARNEPHAECNILVFVTITHLRLTWLTPRDQEIRD